MTAGEDISMMDEKEHHETIHEYHSHVSGLLSSKTKDLYEAGTTDTVRGSLISGNETRMESGRDMTITGSAVVSDKDTTLLAGRNFKADSAEERSGSTYRESVKKRGLLSGGGLGFTFGSAKRKGRCDSEAVEQVGSTIGSVEGSVRIGAGKDADIEASRVSAGKDLAVRGKNVTITSKDNVYTNKEEHEYRRSGLSVSLGGSFVSGVNSVIQPLQKSGEVQDGRLKNLYMADAGMNGRTAIRNFDSAGKIKAGLAVDVGFSSVSSTSKASSYETQAQSSTLTAKEKADIRSGENLSIHGSTIQGKDVDLEARKDIRLTAAENRSEMDIHEKTKNGGISTFWGIGGLSGVKVYGQSAKGMENAVKLGGYATSAINYGYNAYENHQEIKNFHNALQADAWDTLPVSISLMSGIIGSAWLGTWGAMIGTVTLGGMMQTAVDQNKAEMKQAEMQNQNQEERNN